MTGCIDADGADDDFEDEDAKTKEEFKLWLDKQADGDDKPSPTPRETQGQDKVNPPKPEVRYICSTCKKDPNSCDQSEHLSCSKCPDVNSAKAKSTLLKVVSIL